MSPPVRWGLSILDWRYHAVQDHYLHPSGVFQAVCGHLLMGVTELRDELDGRPCDACAQRQLDSAERAANWRHEKGEGE